jgi:chromosome segregation ATPase
METERWLRAALHPLESAMKEYASQLDKRVENLKKLQDNLEAVGTRSKQLERDMLALKAQHEVLASIRKNLAGAEQQPAAPTPTSEAPERTAQAA